MWIQYDYLCTDCDALIQITSCVEPTIDPACNCNASSHVILIGGRNGDVTQITDSHLDSIGEAHYN